MRAILSQERLTELFSIDVRSLALVRVGLGLIVLYDIIRRSFDISVFYGDSGVLPVEYLSTFWTGGLTWSVHTLFGGPLPLLIALFAIHACVALAFTVGYRTRIATIALWFLTVSLDNANPLILQGEDVLLRVTLFVSMFLPLGAAYSFDRSRGSVPERAVFSGWTVAYLLQLGFLYFFVSLYKHSGEWTGGTAIYYALSIDQYATDFGRYLLNFPDALSLLTYSVLIFQSFALFLLFCPVYTAFIRSITVLGLMLMHASFAASMHLGMFSAVSIAALCAFVPSHFWTLAESRVARVFTSLKKRITSLSISGAGVAVPRSQMQAFVSTLGAIYIIYIFIWHLGNSFVPGQYVPFTNGFEVPAKIVRVDQRWNLFAPYPYRHDGWIVIPAVLKNGERVDLFRSEAPLSFERPDVIYESYPRPRWRRYFLSLWIENNERYRVPYAQYLCRTWNETHPSEEQLRVLDIVYMVEWTPAPGEDLLPVRPVSLLSWDCERNAVAEAVEAR